MKTDPSFLNILGDIPAVNIPDISLPSVPDLFSGNSDDKDIFSARKAWHEVNREIPRCDFSPNRQQLKPKKPVYIHCLWRRSVKGPSLTEIKEGEDYVEFFASHMAAFISQCLGMNLASGNWVVLTPPPRRHLHRNFAQRVATLIADELKIRFCNDALEAKNRQRVMARFELVNVPTEANIILYDDIVTTGSTFQACHRALDGLNKNIVYFSSISNE